MRVKDKLQVPASVRGRRVERKKRRRDLVIFFLRTERTLTKQEVYKRKEKEEARSSCVPRRRESRPCTGPS